MFDATTASTEQLIRMGDLMHEMQTISRHGDTVRHAEEEAQAYNVLRDHVAGLKSDYQKMNEARRAGNQALADEYRMSADNHQTQINAAETQLRNVQSVTAAHRDQIALIREAQLIQARQRNYETEHADRSALETQRRDLQTMKDLYRDLNTEIQRYYLLQKQGASDMDLGASRRQIDSLYRQMETISGRSFADPHISSQITDTFNKAGIAVGNFEYKIREVEKEFKGLYGTTTEWGDSVARAADKIVKIGTLAATAA